MPEMGDGWTRRDLLRTGLFGASFVALAGTGLSLPPWEPSTQEFDVAPDGREIAITADLADEPGMLHRTDVVTVDLATRRRRVLTAATGRSDGAPR